MSSKIWRPNLPSGDMVIMDNVSSHKVVEVKEAIEAAGATLHYLPPYSPDLNPIEMAFAKFKAILRQKALRLLMLYGTRWEEWQIGSHQQNAQTASGMRDMSVSSMTDRLWQNHTRDISKNQNSAETLIIFPRIGIARWRKEARQNNLMFFNMCCMA